ncbi:MAG: hypothetical protein IJK75_06625 [Bacteroidales bacterium]|nr:hypothetical protein [Bacteroidales bacterium]
MESNYNFIEKTRKIISQYDLLNIIPEENFDVTLLLNCCVGLLLVAEEKGRGKVYPENHRLEEWHIEESKITIIKKGNRKKGGIIEWRNEEKTIANICRHLRNSIAHCHFKAYSSDGTRIIDRIEFNDYVKEEVKDEQSFQYDTKVTDFRFFLEKLAAKAIDMIQFKG